MGLPDPIWGKKKWGSSISSVLAGRADFHLPVDLGTHTNASLRTLFLITASCVSVIFVLTGQNGDGENPDMHIILLFLVRVMGPSPEMGKRTEDLNLRVKFSHFWPISVRIKCSKSKTWALT